MDGCGTLYNEKIVAAYNSQKHRGIIEDATTYATEENTMCGDELTVYLRISNDIVEEVKYCGEACVVCLGSAEISSIAINGMNVAEIIKIDTSRIDQFIGVIDIRPSMKRCADLFIRAAKAAIRNADKNPKPEAVVYSINTK